jgi:hypothetical protein
MESTAQQDGQKYTISRGLTKVLNRHGYGFHYSVLQHINQIPRSGWGFEVAEMPVEVRGKGTRIDFILRRFNSHLYLVAECKRANPALASWCFVRTPYYRRNQREWRIILEETVFDTEGRLSAGASVLIRGPEVYQIGLEIRSGKKGDPGGGGRGAIEEAATQVCRGLNGMVQFLSTHPRTLPNQGDSVAQFVPVIFTTARLWTSQVDLASADVNTGELEVGRDGIHEVGWLWFQYHLSPGLKHSIPSNGTPEGLGEVLEQDYVRTIGIVSSSGVRDFLQWHGWPDYGY